MVHVLIGTKAQLIKMAPVMREMTERGVDYNFVSTGQHRETIDDILSNFEIKPPDHQLYDGPDITRIPQMAVWGIRILWRGLRRRREVFARAGNGIVLVHGDTLSTLVGAILGKLLRLHVGHVESGLRSFNFLQPFPEELTRLMTFWLSDYYFCPNQWAADNLSGFRGIRINTLANTVLDSLRHALRDLSETSSNHVPTGEFGVATLHRFENFRNRESSERVVDCVERVAACQPLVFILHRPTENALRKFGLYARLDGNARVDLRQRYD